MPEPASVPGYLADLRRGDLPAAGSSLLLPEAAARQSPKTAACRLLSFALCAAERWEMEEEVERRREEERAREEAADEEQDRASCICRAWEWCRLIERAVHECTAESMADMRRARIEADPR